MEIICITKGLDCPNCALQLESKIAKISGVNACSINFMNKKMILDLNEVSTLDEISKVCANFEDGVTLKRIK